MARRRITPEETAAYAASSQTSPCFICTLLRGEGTPHEVVYEDEYAIAFLSRFPTQLGYTLVAPKEHLEHVTGDFNPIEYLTLQRVVHLVGEAIRRAVPTERLYVLSLGSQQGNSHVHWHLVPLPPGVPYDEQQLAALEWEQAGVIELTDEERAELGRRIRSELR